MQQITKKLLAGILVFACVLTLFPECAFAKTGVPDFKKTGLVAEISVQRVEGEKYDLLYNNINSKNIVRRKDVTFDEKKNTLTLKNFKGFNLAVSNLGSDFKLKLVGENSLEHISVLGKYGTGLTIAGTGSLKVNSEMKYDWCPIWINGYDVTSLNFKIEKSCTVDAYANAQGEALGLMGSKKKPKVSFEGMESVKMEDQKSVVNVRYFREEELSKDQKVLDEEVVYELSESGKGAYACLREKDGEYYFLEFVLDEDRNSPYYDMEYPVLYKVTQLYMDNLGQKYAVVKKEKGFPEGNVSFEDYPHCLTVVYRWGEIHTTSDGSQDADDTQETGAIAYQNDANWEALNLSSYDENGDGALDTDEAKKVDVLYGNEKGGLEIDASIVKNFKNLKTLDVENCNIKGKELDLSKNTKLEKLNCSGCPLKKLNVSKCTKLKTLKCDNWGNGSELTTLDISKCTKLTTLNCASNQLTALDTSKCTKLKNLNCSDNKIAKLDVSKCENLLKLNCDDNKITSIDVSKSTKLTKLECDDNMLTKLNVSKNKELTILECSYNKLKALNVSKCTKLKELGCAKNEISKLELSKCKKLKFLYCDASCKVTGYSGEKVCE